MLRVDSISYHVDKGGGESRGEIALTKSSRVIPFAKRALAFQVVTGTKSLTMCASSAREQQEWQEAIQSAIGQLGINSTAAAQEEWHVVSAAGQDFEMSPKYEMIKPIGHGAYGVVISAIDHQTSTNCVACSVVSYSRFRMVVPIPFQKRGRLCDRFSKVQLLQLQCEVALAAMHDLK